jgi:hypothetical protein
MTKDQTLRPSLALAELTKQPQALEALAVQAVRFMPGGAALQPVHYAGAYTQI